MSRAAGIAAAAVAALVLGGCGEGDPDSAANARATPKATVVVTDGAYVPARVHIEAGQRVTFVNRHGEANTAETGGTGLLDYDRTQHARRRQFDVHTLQQGEAESVRLDRPGAYTYYSSLDGDMKGVIEVTPRR